MVRAIPRNNMTAEIVIMNREAIAIAADSAVTLTIEKDQKTFQSANKIFKLSRYHPVAIMISGNTNLLRVPWETIIKVYRRELGTMEFDFLKEYAYNFIDFLNKRNSFFEEKEQEYHVYKTIYSYYNKIKEEIEENVEDVLGVNEEITDAEIKRIIANNIKRHYDNFKELELPPTITKNHLKKLKGKYKEMIDNVKDVIFEKAIINTRVSNQLTEIGINLLVKFSDWDEDDQTEIVITGFGKEDKFPSLQSFLVNGMANNILKYKEGEPINISSEKGSIISPFAQREMVDLFMTGVDGKYEEAITEDLSDLCESVPGIIINSLENLPAAEKESKKRKINDISTAMLMEYVKGLQEYRDRTFVQPIMNVVTLLPKVELAMLAKSLVFLTTLKRKVTRQQETTVAEPIDVAVISKGDGFIWIERKHYFEREMNPHFLANYYGEEKNGEEKEDN